MKLVSAPGFGLFNLLLFLIFFSQKSIADALFIDTNMANREVYLLSELSDSANAIFPEMPNADRKLIDDLNPKYNHWLKLGSQCNDQNKTRERNCRPFWESFGQIENERRAVFQRNRFNFAKLEGFLKKIELGSRIFDKIIISGHNGLGDFYGDTGSLSIAELEKLLEQFPRLRSNAQSLFLWGCYTTTPYKVTSLWQVLFPNAKIIAGYNGMSARSDSSANIRYLGDLLSIVEPLGESDNTQEVIDKINAIPKIENLNFAVFQKQTNTYVSKKFNGDIAEAQSQNCRSAESKIESSRRIFECYYFANLPNCENVPANEHQSELRSTYNFLQAVDGCNDRSQGELMSTSVTIRLIKFRNILKNFAFFYGDKLKEANTILTELNAPANVMIPDFSVAKLSRAQVLLFLKNYYDFLQISSAKKNKKSLILRVTYLLMSKSLYQLSAACVPFGWVEPDSSAAVPQCVKWPSEVVSQATLPGFSSLRVDKVKQKILEYLNSI
jgi:hypothetical protein